MMDGSSTVIINPVAGGGEVGRRRQAITAMLRRAFGGVTLRYTRRAGDAGRLAREAVEQGAETVLSLGGDGTHGGVVDGIMRAGPEPGAVSFGALPGGTGSDFCRLTVGGRDLEASIEGLMGPEPVPLDVGRADYRCLENGARESRYFLNLASCGINGLVDRYANQTSKPFGGRLGGVPTFLWATARAVWNYEPARVRVRVDDEEFGEFDITSVLVCNGRYAGGGMYFAPDASVSDGQFDVVILEDRSALKSGPMMVRLYRGTHLAADGVTLHRGRRVSVEPVGEARAYLDLDGEAPGVAPVNFELVPGALQLLGRKS